MTRLSRIVRLTIQPGGAGGGQNGFGGRPPMNLPGAFFEVEAVVAGPHDPPTGYVIDIKRVDEGVQRHARQHLERAYAGGVRPGAGLRDAAASLVRVLPGLESLSWHLSPFLRVEADVKTPQTVIVRQRFDFAASHRLHVDSLSAEENRRLFGKCNYESGHGHNYRFEPAVRVPADLAALPVAAIEEVCERIIIARFDHRHLNVDTEEFGPRGVNPTVENIARVFYDILKPHVAAVASGAELIAMTVWETDRTSAEYRP
ncbi:MAG TPA: 6-carboxytetrahydropterin synthase [Phycisphaerales bacterium]|nr:6-carboxytetrahydropterin synthase [Phycisphaerales bacterium]